MMYFHNTLDNPWGFCSNSHINKQNMGKTMYASNMTFEERVRLGVIPQECMDIVEETEQKIIEMEKELNYYKGREELLSEQVYFAQEVIGNIQEGVKQARSVGQARQVVEQALAEGYFEM